jgi:hypothetical protein
MSRHPEVLVLWGEPRMSGPDIRAVALRGSLRSHLRVTVNNFAQQIQTACSRSRFAASSAATTIFW